MFSERAQLENKLRLNNFRTHEMLEEMKGIVTIENYDEVIQRRDIRDILSAAPHPVKAMDDSSHTFLDYAIYKRQLHKRPVKQVIDQINKILAGQPVKQLY